MATNNSKKGTPQAKINRREDIIEAAVAVFSELGYYRATTAQIAERAGISQPYVFKFFESKEGLFIAALERSCERIVDAFNRIEAPFDQLEAHMAEAYTELTNLYRKEIILQVQAQAIPDEPIRQAMRASFQRVHDAILERFTAAGLEQPETRTFYFLSVGMLLNVITVLDMPHLKPC
ncbi:TetR/AcrR family transcriptional regulator [Paenibacillus sp. 481]|uniref:TetR/AcrR family transcriptional regulator n=1 Tax=Paenibacillus sp. 481 TaxID=2835869 RepID=UPI001E604B96|nr:TetR/AcrR family transcriptional regulator [Paenibacillus sp. 481]UHA75112.1 TetR/AcrR family transcriptional regulator [Paenibacillus sp. 481]